MSAIFGLIHLDGSPVPADALEPTDALLARLGSDGRAIWSDGVAAMGHRAMWATPEARHERMPMVAAERGATMVAVARLDNRQELCALFSISASQAAATPDTELVRLAFHRWGEECAAHLFGDWSLAAWDATRRRLFLARDHLGVSGLFYAHDGDTLAFSSASWALPGPRRTIDDLFLARYLGIFGGDDDRTVRSGVRRLAPAHALVATPEGATLRAYWSPADVPAVRLRDDQEYVEGFRERYRAAVRCRLRSVGPVAATLSGGLDSGSVVTFAAEELSEHGGRLRALTAVPLRSGGSRGEWAAAAELAGRWDNVEHVAVDAASISPLDAIRRALEIMPDLHHAATNLHWIIALLEEARRGGAGVLLTGQLGNAGVSWNGGRDRLFFLLARGHVGRAAAEMARARRYRGSSWSSVVARELLRPMVGRLRHGNWRYPIGLAARGVPVTRQLARRVDLRGAMRRSGSWVGMSPIAPERERSLTLTLNAGAVGPFWQCFGSTYGIDVRDPTSDVRLLEFCLGVPEAQHILGGGDRMLMRRAMEGSMPEGTLTASTRGVQSPDLSDRVASARRDISDEIARLWRNPDVSSRIDLEALERLCAASSSAVGHRPEQASSLLRGLSAAMFLSLPSMAL